MCLTMGKNNSCPAGKHEKSRLNEVEWRLFDEVCLLILRRLAKGGKRRTDIFTQKWKTLSGYENFIKTYGKFVFRMEYCD